MKTRLAFQYGAYRTGRAFEYQPSVGKLPYRAVAMPRVRLRRQQAKAQFGENLFITALMNIAKIPEPPLYGTFF
jgi:hypothetical protein